MKHVEFHIDQRVGVGQGYFVNEVFPGVNALIKVKNEGRKVLQLVVTRYNAPPFTTDIPRHSDFSIELNNIQTVGIFVPDDKHDKDDKDDKEKGRGRLTIIPNFSNINLV